MTWLLNLVFGSRLEKKTAKYIRGLEQAPTALSRKNAAQAIATLKSTGTPGVVLGHTAWGEAVEIPIKQLLKAHSLITGGTGSGKTMAALVLVRALIWALSNRAGFGFGLVDPKGDLYAGTLFLLAERLEELAREDPQAAKSLRRRIVIYDFSSNDSLNAYNILARWAGAEPDFFAATRSELLLDLLAGSDRLSLSPHRPGPLPASRPE